MPKSMASETLLSAVKFVMSGGVYIPADLLDEVLHLLPRSLPQCFGSTEINGVGLHEFGIEFVLANDLAEPVTNLWRRPVTIPIYILRRQLFGTWRER